MPDKESYDSFPSGVWAIKYDPNFVSARKSKQRGGGALRDHDDHLPGDGMWLHVLWNFFSCPYDDPAVQLMSFGGLVQQITPCQLHLSNSTCVSL